MNLKKLIKKSTPLPWYGCIANKGSAAFEQGLIIPEGPGRDVAVVYDPKDIDLIVHAANMLPKLVKNLEDTLLALEALHDNGPSLVVGQVVGRAKACLNEANRPEIAK